MTQAKKRRYQRIRETYSRTGSIKGTARALGASVNTVRKAIGEDIDSGQVQVRAASGAPRPSVLDAYKPAIQRMVLEDELTAVLVLDEIRTLGYSGGYTTVKDYVRTIRPTATHRATTVIEHRPGEEGQVDWSPYAVLLGSERRIVHAFSLVLPFSRYMFVRFSLNEKLETLLLLHDEAFSAIGAVAKLMTYDNMTTVGRHTSKDEITLNPHFEAYSKHMGFDVALIDPGRPNQHASVERPFSYVENNCLKRRRSRFSDLDDLNRHATWWCNEVANVRIHGTTRERPIDRLERERLLMKPLPSLRDAAYHSVSRKVGTDFCVAVDTNRYSVPPKFVGQPATVRIYTSHLDILVGNETVARHPLCEQRRQRRVLPEHEAAFFKATPSRRLLEQAFIRLGQCAQDYYDGLKRQRGRGAGYHLQRILKLADRHGSSVVVGAMAHAARYGNYSADAVARVVAGREIKNRKCATSPKVAAPPARVLRWLEGLHVEDSDLEDYDRIVDEHKGEAAPSIEPNKGDTEDGGKD